MSEVWQNIARSAGKKTWESPTNSEMTGRALQTSVMTLHNPVIREENYVEAMI
jgi:hypothetical protein